MAGIGNQSVAGHLASGRVKDVLNLPFERDELREISERIRVREFRGTAAIADTAQVAAELPDFSGLRILAVDDNLVNREVLKDALQTFNIEVTLAESGEEALDLVSLRDFDMVFMDCSMPGMDGFEATRHIRDIETHLGRKPVPIVALTAHVSGEESQKWRQSGMNGYLTKPFTIETIVSTIKDQTHHQPSVQANVGLRDEGLRSSKPPLPNPKAPGPCNPHSNTWQGSCSHRRWKSPVRAKSRMRSRWRTSFRLTCGSTRRKRNPMWQPSASAIGIRPIRKRSRQYRLITSRNRSHQLRSMKPIR
ncbi:MAG: response regulator [Nitratireductor sp.]